MDRNAFPDLPPTARGLSAHDPLMQLNRLLLRACSAGERESFQDAASLAAALRQLNAPSFFAGPFTWREKRLLALAAALAFLLLASDALLVYLGWGRHQAESVAIEEVVPTDQDSVRGKFESNFGQ